MNRIDWAVEPDLGRLAEARQLLGRDPARGLAGLETLAGGGSAMAALYIGDHHSHVTPPDDAAALRWYDVATALGSPQAAHLAGRIRHRSEDAAGAFAAFTAGAAKGYLPAVYQLANMHRLGLGTPRSLADAIRLLRQAAAGGHLYARRDLAGLMVAGRLGPAAILPGALRLTVLWADLARAPFRKGGRLDERVIA